MNVLSRSLNMTSRRLQLEGNEWKWLALIVSVALVVRVVWILATLPMPNLMPQSMTDWRGDW